MCCLCVCVCVCVCVCLCVWAELRWHCHSLMYGPPILLCCLYTKQQGKLSLMIKCCVVVATNMPPTCIIPSVMISLYITLPVGYARTHLLYTSTHTYTNTCCTHTHTHTHCCTHTHIYCTHTHRQTCTHVNTLTQASNRLKVM